MGRFCYCSKLLPGKANQVRAHWKNKANNESPDVLKAEEDFWKYLQMVGFESWLQPTIQGDYLIHCLEGASLSQIFKSLREQISVKNRIALQLRDFYLEVLGKDYSFPEVEPKLQHLLDISLPTKTQTQYIKRGFFFPLLREKEADHIRFKKEAMGKKRERHEESMQAFGVSHLSSWIQTTEQGKYLITYTERHKHTPDTSEARLQQAVHSSAWEEISSVLMDHTGLKLSELSPDVEWLTDQPVH